jgi:hypothetical protein
MIEAVFRILGSEHMITDPDLDPSIFCLFLTVDILTSVVKDNMSLRSRKPAEIMVRLIFCLLMEGSGSGPGSV